MNRTIVAFAAAAATLAAAISVLRWLDARHTRLSREPRKALQSWENEGGTLSSSPRQVGVDISQVPG